MANILQNEQIEKILSILLPLEEQSAKKRFLDLITKFLAVAPHKSLFLATAYTRGGVTEVIKDIAFEGAIEPISNFTESLCISTSNTCLYYYDSTKGKFIAAGDEFI